MMLHNKVTERGNEPRDQRAWYDVVVIGGGAGG